MGGTPTRPRSVHRLGGFRARIRFFFDRYLCGTMSPTRGGWGEGRHGARWSSKNETWKEVVANQGDTGHATYHWVCLQPSTCNWAPRRPLVVHADASKMLQCLELRLPLDDAKGDLLASKLFCHRICVELHFDCTHRTGKRKFAVYFVECACILFNPGVK